MSAPQLGRVGIWSLEMRFGDPAESIEAAAELDDLGFGALWIPGGIDSGVLKSVDALLEARSEGCRRLVCRVIGRSQKPNHAWTGRQPRADYRRGLEKTLGGYPGISRRS